MKGNPASRAQGERTRAAIVAAIANGAVRQSEIAARIGVTQSTVCHHINLLIAYNRVREVKPRRVRVTATYEVVP